MSWYRWQDAGLILSLRIQPGASGNDFAGLHGGTLKVRIKSPASEGRANRELISFFAAAFGTAKSNVRVLRGESARAKTVRIDAPTRIPAEIAALEPRVSIR